MNNEGDLEFIRRAVGRGAEEHKTIDLAWRGGDGCVARGTAAHTGTDHGYGLRTGLPQIAHSGQHIEMERGAERFGLARTSRISITAEIDRQHAKPGRCEKARLFLPSFPY